MPMGKNASVLSVPCHGECPNEGCLKRILPAAQFMSVIPMERVKLLVSQLGINSVQGNEELVRSRCGCSGG